MVSWSRTSLLALLFAACCVALLATGAVVAQDEPAAPGVDEFDANTTMVIELESDGDAHWTVNATMALESESAQEAFRELATEFENGQTESLGLGAFEGVSSTVDAETDRDMALTNVTRASSGEDQIANGTGTLSLGFTWENFSRVEDDRVIVDDALYTDQGIWLQGLDRNQSLVMRGPPGYGIFDATFEQGVETRNGALHWTGPTAFTEESLRVTFIGDGGSPISPPQNGFGDQLAWLAGLGLVFATGVMLAYFLVSRREGISGPMGSTGGEESVGAGTAAGVGDTATTPAPEDEPAIDVELLSDEERITRLLEQNGGRMKQADIVKETDWSNAKVSQLLSSMAEEGEVNKLRIGRENLISFPEDNLTDIESDK